MADQPALTPNAPLFPPVAVQGSSCEASSGCNRDDSLMFEMDAEDKKNESDSKDDRKLR